MIRTRQMLAVAMAAAVALSATVMGGCVRKQNGGSAAFVCLAGEAGDLAYGASKQEADRLFNGEDGEPAELIPYGSGQAAAYGTSIVLFNGDKAVYCLVAGEGWKLPNGIGVGSTRDELYAAYDEGMGFASEIVFKLNSTARQNENLGGAAVEMPEPSKDQLLSVIDSASYLDVAYHRLPDGSLEPVARAEAPVKADGSGTVTGYFYLFFELEGDAVSSFGVGGLEGYYLLGA